MRLLAFLVVLLGVAGDAHAQMGRLYEGNVEIDNVVTTTTSDEIDLDGAETVGVQATVDVNTPSAGVFTAAADDICTDTAHGFTTGLKGQASTTTTLPAGLSAATDYFVIVVSADTYKLADSLANALAGTAIDITDAGTGTHTFTPTSLAGATVKLEKSNDNVNWSDVAAATSITADGTTWLEIDRPKFRWLRISYTLTAGRLSSDNHVLVKGVE